MFSENKLDWDKLKATFSGDINFANERYVLNGLARVMHLRLCKYLLPLHSFHVKDAELNFDNPENQTNHKNPSPDNGFKVFKLSPSNFKISRRDEITEDNLVQ